MSVMCSRVYTKSAEPSALLQPLTQQRRRLEEFAGDRTTIIFRGIDQHFDLQFRRVEWNNGIAIHNRARRLEMHPPQDRQFTDFCKMLHGWPVRPEAAA